MEGGLAEQCWSGEEEVVFIADVLVAVHIKNATENEYHRRFT